MTYIAVSLFCLHRPMKSRCNTDKNLLSLFIFLSFKRCTTSQTKLITPKLRPVSIFTTLMMCHEKWEHTQPGYSAKFQYSPLECCFLYKGNTPNQASTPHFQFSPLVIIRALQNFLLPTSKMSYGVGAYNIQSCMSVIMLDTVLFSLFFLSFFPLFISIPLRKRSSVSNEPYI